VNATIDEPMRIRPVRQRRRMLSILQARLKVTS
jgi:hypothetical protein